MSHVRHLGGVRGGVEDLTPHSGGVQDGRQSDCTRPDKFDWLVLLFLVMVCNRNSTWGDNCR